MNFRLVAHKGLFSKFHVEREDGVVLIRNLGFVDALSLIYRLETPSNSVYIEFGNSVMDSRASDGDSVMYRGKCMTLRRAFPLYLLSIFLRWFGTVLAE